MDQVKGDVPPTSLEDFVPWGLERHNTHPRRCDFQTFKPPKTGGLRNNTADGSPSLELQ